MSLREATYREGDYTYIYDAERIGERDLFGLFVATPAAAAQQLHGGRAATWIASHDDNQYVVRHYRRGGALARVSVDRYLWTGDGASRPWREWRLLARMHGEGLAVPAPLAARLSRHGLVYRADIATARLPVDGTLAQVVQRRDLPESTWSELGRLIWRFHRAGICHADLNANNVMLAGTDRLWLIDFDKAAYRPPRPAWQLQNLARLKRSLDKLLVQHPASHFSEHAWHCLFGAYSKASNVSPSSD